MNKYNVTYLLPKVLFIVPVIIVIVDQAWDLICKARGRERKPTNYAALCFFLVGTWMTSEALDIVLNRLTDPQRELIHDAVAEAGSALGGIEVEADDRKVFEGLSAEIERAENRIDVISWHAIGNKNQEKRAERMFAAFERRAIDSERPILQRRLLWLPQHLASLAGRLATLARSDQVELRYLQDGAFGTLPILPCVIFDSSVVHMGMGYIGSDGDEKDLIIRHKVAVEQYNKYFNFLWQRSTVIKAKGEGIDNETVRCLIEGKGKLPK